MRKCSICQGTHFSNYLRRVDDQWICIRCLCGNVNAIDIWPIGVVAQPPDEIAASYDGFNGKLSLIRLYSGQRRFLRGLTAESRLTVLWYCHRTRNIQTLFARGFDGKKVGPYASRSSHRMNSIAISDVKLLDVVDNQLVVGELDAMAGSPVIDIKMSLPT